MGKLRGAFERAAKGLPSPSLTLRCVTCGRFVGFRTALAVTQINRAGWQTIAPGPYDSRCAAKVPRIRAG